MGGGDYALDAPPHSFIDVKDFHNVEDLAEYMKYLISNSVSIYLLGPYFKPFNSLPLEFKN